MSARHLWLFFRYSRWLLFLAWLGYCLEFVIHREQHMGTFNELSRMTEFWMFGIALVAVLFGLLELMTRDMAGIKWEPKNPIGLDRSPASSPQGQSPPLQPAPEGPSKTTTTPDKPRNRTVPAARIDA
jgi:hypothetical protein